MDSEQVKGWWASLPHDRKIILGAVALNFVSQFFRYRSQTGGGFLTHATDTDYYTGLVLFGGHSAAIGWRLHPLAVLILPGLAYVFASAVQARPWWRKWGWWIAAVLLFVAASPADVATTLGGFLGFAAFLVAIWGALVHRKATAQVTPVVREPPRVDEPADAAHRRC